MRRRRREADHPSVESTVREDWLDLESSGGDRAKARKEFLLAVEALYPQVIHDLAGQPLELFNALNRAWETDQTKKAEDLAATELQRRFFKSLDAWVRMHHLSADWCRAFAQSCLDCWLSPPKEAKWPRPVLDTLHGGSGTSLDPSRSFLWAYPALPLEVLPRSWPPGQSRDLEELIERFTEAVRSSLRARLLGGDRPSRPEIAELFARVHVGGEPVKRIADLREIDTKRLNESLRRFGQYIDLPLRRLPAGRPKKK